MELMEPGRPVAVLVVDDEADIAESTAAVLTLHGYETRTVYDGASALAAALDCPPDVVLLDLHMPGIDGYELARELHKHCTVVRPLLVAISAWGTADDMKKSRDAGIDLHLVKPVEPAMLVGLIRRFRRVFATSPSA